jgi:hypothetical protein
LQAVYRGYRERKKFRGLKRATIIAQKLYRGQKQREKFKVLKEEMAKRAEIERASRERAKAKQQREEQERASRAVAGVNHLEIPAELAFIYSKLDGNPRVALFAFLLFCEFYYPAELCRNESSKSHEDIKPYYLVGSFYVNGCFTVSPRHSAQLPRHLC